MKRLSTFIVFSLFISASLCLQGCSSTTPAINAPSTPSGDGSQNTMPGTKERTRLVDGSPSDLPDDAAINSEAQRRAERLQQELDRLKQEHGLPTRESEIDRKFAQANAQPTTEPRNTDVVFPKKLDEQAVQAAKDPSPRVDDKISDKIDDKPVPETTSQSTADLVANPSPEHVIETKVATHADPKAGSETFDPNSLDRKTLTQLLVQKIIESNDPNASNVIAIAGLALADADGVVDPLRIEGLKPSERQLVQQFQSLFTQVSQRMAKGEAIDKNSVIEQINSIIGEQPLSIRKLKLCSRVRGYGVYTELPATTLLAGREHPFIVYAELDNFAVKTSDKNLYNQQVKLSQELVLYNATDGLAVWRQPEQSIVDESRNRRRDFFTVQPTRLPARLGAGKYILKVRVRDKHAGTRAEESIEIDVVADPSLVKPNVVPTNVRPG